MDYQKVFKIEWHSPWYDGKVKYFDNIKKVILYLSDDRGFSFEFKETALNLWDNFEEGDIYNWENFHEFSGLYSGLTFEVFLCGVSLDELIESESEEIISYTHDSLFSDLNNINYGWDEGYISDDLAKSMTKHHAKLFSRLN